MVQNDNVSSEIQTTAAENASVVAIIGKRFPDRIGQVRRIHPVWGSYFRVNFHDPENENKVVESHFISVADNAVTEVN